MCELIISMFNNFFSYVFWIYIVYYIRYIYLLFYLVFWMYIDGDFIDDLKVVYILFRIV